MDARAALASLDEEDSVSDNKSNTSKSESDSNAASIDGRNYSDEEGSARIGNIYHLVQPTSTY
jgi:hypothetical protein